MIVYVMRRANCFWITEAICTSHDINDLMVLDWNGAKMKTWTNKFWEQSGFTIVLMIINTLYSTSIAHAQKSSWSFVDGEPIKYHIQCVKTTTVVSGMGSGVLLIAPPVPNTQEQTIVSPVKLQSFLTPIPSFIEDLDNDRRFPTGFAPIEVSPSKPVVASMSFDVVFRKRYFARKASKDRDKTYNTLKQLSNLSTKQVSLYTEPDDYLINYDNPIFERWFTDNKLQRSSGEDRLDYCVRLLKVMQNKITYKNDGSDETAKTTCQKGYATCYGIAATFISTMRKNHIPARMVYGRYISLINMGTHSNCQIYDDRFGWVTVDPTEAVYARWDALSCIGGDNDFVALQIGGRVDLPTNVGSQRLQLNFVLDPYWVLEKKTEPVLYGNYSVSWSANKVEKAAMK